MVDLIKDELNLMEDKKVIKILNKIYNLSIKPILSNPISNSLSTYDPVTNEFLNCIYTIDKTDDYLKNVTDEMLNRVDSKSYKSDLGKIIIYNSAEI